MHSASRWQYWYYHRISRIPHTRYAVEGLTDELVLYGLAPGPARRGIYTYARSCCIAQDMLECNNTDTVNKKMDQIKMHETIKLNQA